MRYTCETCSADAGSSGIACWDCLSARLAALLNCPEWRANAAKRSGDTPGLSLLQTIELEHNHANRMSNAREGIAG